MEDSRATVRVSIDLALASQRAFDVFVEELIAALARGGMDFEPGGRVNADELEIGRVVD